MSRLRRIATQDRIFFVTANLLRTQNFLSEIERDTVLQVLDSQRERGAYSLFAYVVMPDHFHLLLRPHNADLSAGMRAVKSISGLRIARLRGTKGAIWQPRYFDNVIRHVRNFWEKLDYIHNNPVAAGLVERAEHWRWSSYAAYTPAGAAAIPVDKPIDLPTDGDALLWPAL
jgi:putative transposase